jgi:hypothetical protein
MHRGETNSSRAYRRRRLRSARRGSVYVAVLGSSLLVTGIGLGALAVARSRSAAAAAEADRTRARDASRAAMDLALARLVAEGREPLPDADGRWLDGVPIGLAVATVDVVDPVDGRPTEGADDPLRVLVVGGLGGAVQRSEAMVRIAGHAGLLGGRVIAGQDIRLDADSSIAGEGVMAAAQSVDAGAAPVHLDVRAGTSISGSAVHGLRFIGVDGLVPPDISGIAAVWDDAAVVIDVEQLPAEPPPLPPLLYMESFETRNGRPTNPPANWNGAGCDMQRQAVADAPDGEHAAWIGWGDSPAAQWWIHAWVNANRIVPRVVVAVRPDPPGSVAEFEMDIKWNLWSGSTTKTDRSAVVRSEGGWVELDVTCTAPTHEFSGSLNIRRVSGTSNFVVDHVRVYDAAASADAGATPRLLERVRLSPDANPFGGTSGGVYLIDLGGEDLVIRDCVIEGTLILRNPGPQTRIEGSVAWRPVDPGDPILIVEGGTTPTIAIATDEVPLAEQTLGVDLDGDGRQDSVIASRFEGVLLVHGHVVLGGRPRVAGSLIARGTVSFEGANTWFDAGSVDPGRIPAGFPIDRRTVTIEP